MEVNLQLSDHCSGSKGSVSSKRPVHARVVPSLLKRTCPEKGCQKTRASHVCQGCSKHPGSGKLADNKRPGKPNKTNPVFLPPSNSIMERLGAALPALGHQPKRQKCSDVFIRAAAATIEQKLSSVRILTRQDGPRLFSNGGYPYPSICLSPLEFIQKYSSDRLPLKPTKKIARNIPFGR